MPLTYEQRQKRFYEKTGRYYGDYKPPDPDKQLKTNVMAGKELAPAESLYAQARGYIKPEKPVNIDHSEADADSLGLWTQQAIHGDKTAAEKITARDNLLHPEKPDAPSEYEKIRARLRARKADKADSIRVGLIPRAGKEQEPDLTPLDEAGYKAEKDIISDQGTINTAVEADADTTYIGARKKAKRKTLDLIPKLKKAGFENIETGTIMKKKVDSVWPTYQQKLKKSPVEANAWLMSEFDGEPLPNILKLIDDLKD